MSFMWRSPWPSLIPPPHMHGLCPVLPGGQFVVAAWTRSCRALIRPCVRNLGRPEHILRELIETVGAAATRGILTRLEFAHGWRTAEALEELPSDSEDDFRTAGARIHTLQGQVLPSGGRTARNLSR